MRSSRGRTSPRSSKSLQSGPHRARRLPDRRRTRARRRASGRGARRSRRSGRAVGGSARRRAEASRSRSGRPARPRRDPAERSQVDGFARDERARVVAQLELEPRRRDSVRGRQMPTSNRERLAGEELKPLLAFAAEQRGRGDRRLARAPLAQPGPALGRVDLVRECAPVASDRFPGRPVECDAARARGRPTARRGARRRRRRARRRRSSRRSCLKVKMRPKHLRWNASSPTANTSSSSRMSASRNAAIAKPRRIVIPDEYVRTGRSIACSSSANATISSKRVADLGSPEPLDRAVQEDVLAPGEVGVEAGAELEQRPDAAVRRSRDRSSA